MSHSTPRHVPEEAADSLAAVLSCRSTAGQIVVELLPQLSDRPERRAELLRGWDRLDLYLIVVGGLSHLVVRRDLRRVAIERSAAQAGWGRRELRWAASRARLSGSAIGDRLTARGWARAGASAERLSRSAAEPLATERWQRLGVGALEVGEKAGAAGRY